MLSYIENIETILRAVKESGAKRILDVGGGMGKYALLIREDEVSSRAELGDMSPVPQIVIDCCEDTTYFTSKPHHHSLYDHHYHADVFTMPFPNDYDLILFIDTVEHWDKNKTKGLFEKLKGNKLISTPKGTVMYTQHFFGDERHHITQWGDADFNGKNYSTQKSYIYLI
jgi:2-polyprenyl-3-methyl-5-hydroxy-6-metoxy-1,4-benzoquinol methylase